MSAVRFFDESRVCTSAAFGFGQRPVPRHFHFQTVGQQPEAKVPEIVNHTVAGLGFVMPSAKRGHVVRAQGGQRFTQPGNPVVHDMIVAHAKGMKAGTFQRRGRFETDFVSVVLLAGKFFGSRS